MPALEEPIVTQEESNKPVNKKDFNVEKFIKDNLPVLDRVIIKINCHHITKSYWRINIWGKKLNSEAMFGDNEIVLSKFVRIDVDKNGNMKYNDVTDGKLL